MVLLARSTQTVKIRHSDKGSLCCRMSNALTDESEALPHPPHVLLLIFLLSLSTLSPFIHLFHISLSPSPSLLSLSFRGCQSIRLSLWLSFSFSSCHMFFCSPTERVQSLSVSCRILLTCSHCHFRPMYVPYYLYLNF